TFPDMSSIPYFATATAPLGPRRALDTLYSPHQAKPNTNSDLSAVPNRHHSAPADSTTSISLPSNRIAAEEYRTAGQPLNQELHPFPFPHAAVKENAQATSPPERTATSTSWDSDSSLGVSGQTEDDRGEAVVRRPKVSSDTTLRQQHYNVLTSLLHRCLMERDYMRASRAWGMLLRLEVHGHPLDIRAQERWGIGAELFLHGNSPDDARPNLENLMKAKEYYERLILQYPYRKHCPNTVSSLTFYPVMFGIWIYSVQLRYEIAVQRSIGRSEDDGNPEAKHPADNEFEESVSVISTAPEAVQIEASRTAVEQANEVVRKLGELLISPPYSDHPGLWKIQGMLYLWLSQLLGQIPNEERQGSQKALRKAYEALAQALKQGAT
ncbi:MAG: hypothetical protein Q9180_008813, partial [Flavoplaca navasiana]